MILASFPSPDRSVWDLGPIPIRAYALCIIAGIIAAIWIGERRWVERGGKRGTVSDVAVWAVISGLIGGRVYHVITDNELYFREGRDPWRALYVWEGGLGIWGAIAFGGVGAWFACRQRGISLRPFADAVAPGIAVAQSIGRWGNYFNQELFGKPTDLPWAVEIDPDRPSTIAGVSTYHPTFLYESLWTMALAVVLILVDRRYRMGRGRVFALYLMGYTLGRVWIELLRIDTANELFGARINVWTSIVVFFGALAYFLLNRGPRETDVEPSAPAQPTPADEATDTDATTTTGSATTTATDAEPDPTADAKSDPAAGTKAATATGSTSDAAGDVKPGTAVEATADTAADTKPVPAADEKPVPAADETDTAADLESDAGADAGSDAGADAGSDAGADAGSDAGADAGSDVGADAGSDVGADAGSDAGADAGSDAGADTQSEGPVGAKMIASADGPAAEADRETDAETDADAADAAEGGAGSGGATAAGELTAEEKVAATPTDEPLTVERRRRLLQAGRRKR